LRYIFLWPLEVFVMSTSIQILVFIATTAAFLGIANFFASSREEKQRHDRLSGRRPRSQAAVVQKTDFKSVITGFLEPVGKRLSSKQNQNKLRRDLQTAGYYGTRPVTVFLGARLVLTIVLPVVFVVYGSVLNMPLNFTFMMVVVLAVLGLRMPGFWLARKITRRRASLQRGLPDCLDLLVVCVESGLGIDSAILKISEKMTVACPELAQELRFVHLEMQAGQTRRDALRHLGERTGVKDIQSLVAKLIQSEKFGTGVAKSLRVHADTIREKRKQQAEEQAGKTAVKLLFPLVLFIFPALFVAILGPAILRMIEALGKGLG